MSMSEVCIIYSDFIGMRKGPGFYVFESTLEDSNVKPLLRIAVLEQRF